MKILLSLLLLIGSVYSQHFTENFSDKTLKDYGFEAHWIILKNSTHGYVDTLDNTANNYDLAKQGSPLVGTTVSSGNHLFESGADAVDFVAASSQAYRIASASVVSLNMGASQDFSVIIRMRMPSSFPGTQIPFSKRNTTGYNSSTESGGSWLFTWYNGSAFRNATKSLMSVNQDATGIATADRDGNGSWYVNSTTSVTPIDISADAALTYGTNGNLVIGAFNTLSLEHNGLIYEVAIIKRLLTSKEIKEIMGTTSPGWVTKHGEVARNGTDFTQGINGAGLAVKVGTGSYVSQSLTASSVTYSISLGVVNLLSDSIFIATNTDTLSHALADSTLPDGYQWTLSIDAQETGGVVYVDNLSLTTSLIPVDTGQDKGFKEHSKFKRFKSLK